MACGKCGGMSADAVDAGTACLYQSLLFGLGL